MLEWDGQDAICRVVWAYNDMCGVVFDDPISRHVVDKSARAASSDEPAAEVGNIPLGKRSSLRAVLVRNDGEGAA